MHSRSQPAGAAALTDRVEMDAVGSMKVRSRTPCARPLAATAARATAARSP